MAAPPDRLAPSGVLPSRATILVLYGLIGATSFGYELIWFRSLVFYLQSATYSFSLMLALFLLGIGLGSAVYARFFQKRAMTPSAVLQTLAVVQIGIGFCGVCALHVYGFLPGIWELLTILVGAGSWHVILAQKAIVAGLIILPPTFLMGISFPLMARLFIAHGAGDARVISRLYASNTLGSIVGSLLTGFVLFDAIGIQPTLNLLALTSLGIGAFLTFAVRRAGGLGAGFATLAAGLGVTALAILVSTPDRLLVKHFARFQGEIPFYRESASDITFVYERNGYLHLGFGDGRGTSGASPFHNAGNRLLAYTAMVVNPDAKDILVVSMGCGNTASAFTAFPIDRLDIVDISSGPFEAAHLFSTNLDVLEDPRVHTYVEDGRNFLLKSERRYDIIQIELPSLHTDGVAFLYTREFYEIARTRLKEGGILSQWIDASQAGRELSYRLIETMAQVLPDISVWQEVTTWWAIGAERPLKVDYEKVRALFALDSVQRDMAIVDSSLETTFRSFASYGTTLRETLGTGPIITDDQTRVDFIIPKRGISDAMGGGVGYYNAPLGKMFRRRWTQDGTFPTRPDMGFYPGDRRHRAQLRSRSLQSFASGYWADERQRLRRKLREPLPAT